MPVTDLARTYDRRAPIVVINARTHRRHLIWAELDSNGVTPETTGLLIHPGVNWREGQRYIVALRNLKDGAGKRIEPGRAFELYRDRVLTDSKEFESRRGHMESLFGSLRKAGIDRGDLYLAWDFTVASGNSLSRRMVSIRDRAFAELGDRNLRDLKVEGASPKFTVDKVIEATPEQEPNVFRRVEGKVTVPCFLNAAGCPPGSRYDLGPDGLPRRIAGQHLRRALRLQHPALREPRQAGAPVAVRARPVRRRRRGGRPQRGGAGQRERRARLRGGLDRHGRRGRGQRHHGPPGPVALPDARRPPPAGLPRLHVRRAGR